MAKTENGGKSAATFRLYGLRISADFPLPELAPVNESRIDVELRTATVVAPAIEPFMIWTTPAGENWLSFHKSGGRFLLQFADKARFAIDFGGNKVDCARCGNVPETTFRHLLLDQVTPMVVTLRGQEALHASAVITPEGAIGFCGATGSGKSTLAAIFSSAGDTLLTDDCLAISESGGEVFGAPGYPGLRLWSEVVDDFGWSGRARENVAHYTSKRRVKRAEDAANFPREPVRLSAIYVLERDDTGKELAIEKIRQRDQMMGLLSFAFRLDVTDRAGLAQQFRTMERYAALLPVRKIRLPRNPQRIPHLRERILEDVAGGNCARRSVVSAPALNPYAASTNPG